MQKAEKQYLFVFGSGARHAEGPATMRTILGLRGAHLAELAQNGFPVPAGFTISTEACAYFHKHAGQWPAGLHDQIKSALRRMEAATGKVFGDSKNPLLLCVRCDAAVRVPGLMDAILNIGLNEQTVEGFCESVGNARAGWESYARLLELFGSLVLSEQGRLIRQDFEAERSKLKDKYGASQSADLSAAHLRELCGLYNKRILAQTGAAFPAQPADQLRAAINAAMASWTSERAEAYRRTHKVVGLLGASVNVSAMVFGNLNEESGIGQVSSRDGRTGASRPAGRYRVQAQGPCREDEIRLGKDFHDMPREKTPAWKKVYEALLEIMLKLEQHYRHPQEIEFAVENGRLWLLQTLPAPRTGRAAIRWAVEMATGQDISTSKSQLRIFKPEDAMQMVSASDFEQFLFPQFAGDSEKTANRLCEASPLLPGAVAGRLAFSGEKALEWRKKDRTSTLLLVLNSESQASPRQLSAVQGILACGAVQETTIRWARDKGLVGIRLEKAACGDERHLQLGSRTLGEGDCLSLNGFTGAIYENALPVEPGPLLKNGRTSHQQAEERRLYRQILAWSDKFRGLSIRVNAGDAADVEMGRRLGAQGVGLLRMDALLREAETEKAVFEYAVSATRTASEKALAKVQALLRQSIEEVLRATDGIPLAVSLSRDPPVRPAPEKGRERLRHPGREELWEGLSGGRLLYLRPEFFQAQIRALAESAILVEKKAGRVPLEIYIPGILTRPEFEALARQTREGMEALIKEKKSRIRYAVGLLVDNPRTALMADTMTESLDGLAVDVAALTRSCLGVNEDTARHFLSRYVGDKLLGADPFQHLDLEGVGPLIETSIRRCREARPGISCGLFGDQSTDAACIRLCYKTGVEWMACSPCRVPIARFLAAQIALKA